ncbi:MAG TPA: HAD-IIB family hydrolase [Spirochaetia bacterium]|nr:HAD-IIB family hydrolase [Spirochaetia bacterium]
MSAVRPAPVQTLPAALCRDLAYLFADIDDTLTTNGMLPDSSYQALWDLWRAGIRVVPVTGRPGGWCDHIARMWPVAGIVGENGAFFYAYDRTARKMKRRYQSADSKDAQESLSERARTLDLVAARVLKEVPGTALAADQPFRISDVAIDYCEDVPPLPPASVQDICRILREEGVHFKVSSIHVNFWLGSFDKLSGVRMFVQEDAGMPLATLARKSIFVGDSPNDEPLFEGFAHSIAVANIRGFLSGIRHLPEFITRADRAEGFCEAVRVILAGR